MKPFEQFNDLVTAAAEQAHRMIADLANAGRFEPAYLYHKPSTAAEPGHLLMIADSDAPPAGYKLATGEGLRCNVPYAHYWAWIHQRAVSLPLLPYGA